MLSFTQLIEEITRLLVAGHIVITPIITAEWADGFQASGTLIAHLNEVEIVRSLKGDAHFHPPSTGQRSQLLRRL